MLDHSKVRLIAFYLPQYHPIPENDQWWGDGFTEWTNVAKAKPLFSGHYQPHLPGELGFYDLGSAEVRQAQAELARSHGIFGFCYYHYWFGGKRLLEKPLEEVLSSQQPEFPFCLCWANENWTRTWDGQDEEVLMPQCYSQEDDIRHILFLCKVFKDKRYIKIDGKPLFLIYRADKLPDFRRTAALWRDVARREGVGEIFLALVDHGNKSIHDVCTDAKLDASVEFQPIWYKPENGLYFVRRVVNKLIPWTRRHWPFFSHCVVDYEKIARHAMKKRSASYKQFPCVAVGYDNSPRKSRDAFIARGSSPEKYGMWLRATIAKIHKKFKGDERIVFINAWNEWAEGNHLEPDKRWGRAYLEATQKALS